MTLTSSSFMQITLSFLSVTGAVTYPLYSFLKREKTPVGFLLFVAFACSAFLEFSDLMAVVHQESMWFWKNCALLSEACLPFVWLTFTFSYAREGKRPLYSPWQLLVLLLSVLTLVFPFIVPGGNIFYSPDFSQEHLLFLGTWGVAFYCCIMACLIISLINLEVTLTSASLTARWKIKFEVVGIGGFLTALVFYYSQGLLYRTINMNLMPVRSVALLVAVLLVAYSQLRRKEDAKIHVARTLVYKSVVLFAVGLYLIGLGLMGEGLRYFGASFYRSVGTVLGFIVGIGFLTVLFSETVKRKLKVHIYKNFYQNKYDYRLQWLQFTERLTNFNYGHELLTSILTGYCETFGMGCGCLFLVDSENMNYTLAAKMEIDQIESAFSKQDTMIRFIQERKWVMNIQERLPGFVSETTDRLRKQGILFVIPMFARDSMEGLVLLGRPLNRNETYNFEDYDLMKSFACQASSVILNLRLSDQLVQAREMEAIGKISAFVIHDLKNLVYTLSLMTENGRDYIADPEFQHDMLESLDNTIGKMRVLIDKLKYLPEKNVLQKEPTDLLGIAKEAAAQVPVEIRVTGKSVTALLDREEMQKVLLNLVINAVDAMGGEGPVMVEVGDDGQPFIRVTDRGTGIPDEFMPSLFRPFTTTKNKGLGIGLYQCKQIVEAHDGKIEVETEVGSGTTFTVRM